MFGLGKIHRHLSNEDFGTGKPAPADRRHEVKVHSLGVTGKLGMTGDVKVTTHQLECNHNAFGDNGGTHGHRAVHFRFEAPGAGKPNAKK